LARAGLSCDGRERLRAKRADGGGKVMRAVEVSRQSCPEQVKTHGGVAAGANVDSNEDRPPRKWTMQMLHSPASRSPLRVSMVSMVACVIASLGLPSLA